MSFMGGTLSAFFSEFLGITKAPTGVFSFGLTYWGFKMRNGRRAIDYVLGNCIYELFSDILGFLRNDTLLFYFL